MIASLQACEGAEDSPIYVYADGPKTQADFPLVQATRAAARELLGDRGVFIEQEHNRGLANSIIAGTTELSEQHGAVVVVEDDLALAPSFLRFLNEGLERYRDEPNVMQVSGHMFDVPSIAERGEALFLPMTTSWGWATWHRAWSLFDPSAAGWAGRLADDGEIEAFNLGGRYDYASMLKRQMNGEIDSWAIRWYYTVFARDGLVLFPPRTLVHHEGFDMSATHARSARKQPWDLPSADLRWSMPSHVIESSAASSVFDAVSRASKPDLWRTIKSIVASRRSAH